MSFLGEIKRRKVFQVAAVYAVVAWLLIQIVATIEEPLNLPDWMDTFIIVLLAVGFPITIIISWSFNLTPEGLVREGEFEKSAGSSGRKIEYALIGLLIVAVAWLVYRDIGPTGGVMAGDDGVLRNSVAVLPFENLSPDPENAYFAAGIHEEILNQLAKIRDLSVISRTSVLRYVEERPPIPEIATELNVQAVMEGSVRFANGHVRIQAQLIDGKTDEHLWAEVFERDLEDIFVIQAEIAEQIAIALEAELSPDEQRRIEKPLTSSPEAFSLYLQATNLRKPNPDGFGPMDDLHRYLDQAIDLDPGFSRAHALKAYDYVFAMVRDRLPTDPTVVELERLAYEHSVRALSLDPEESLAYVAMANIHRFNWRAREAEGAFIQALRLAPNDFASLSSYAHFLSFLEEFERAIELAERAIEIEPFGSGVLAAVNIRAGNFDTAFVEYNNQLRSRPLSRGPNATLAIINWHRGNEDGAVAWLQEAESQIPDSDASTLAEFIQAYGMFDRREDARRLFLNLEKLADDHHVAASSWALACLGIGDYEQAMAWLQHIEENRSPEDSIRSFAIAINEDHDPVLERPVFLEIRKRLALRR